MRPYRPVSSYKMGQFQTNITVMELHHHHLNKDRTAKRFEFLSDALHGRGGFAPDIFWTYDSTGTMQKPERVIGPCYLFPYPRESQQKFAARAACATYESHLREACERFTAYLGRKAPNRANADSPLVQMLVNDADDSGNHIDVFWQNFMIEALARGTMLLLIDMPAERYDMTMAQTLQDANRAVPYIEPIFPEDVAHYVMGRHGRFDSIAIRSFESINGQQEPVIRKWDAQDWAVIKGTDYRGSSIIRQGTHPFGQCPVLIYTENSSRYPAVGRFAQIADLSLRLYNARIELDEILRSQTFSLLTLQIPIEASPDAAAQATATIGTHSMLIHQGDTPAFIAPDSGPAQIYLAKIEELRAAIGRISMEAQIETGTKPESGISRKMRFEMLNASLSRFARGMQDLEARMWQLFNKAMGTTQVVEVSWPSDYNLTDTTAELDTLLTMQQTGFPLEVIHAKQLSIVAAEFDRADPEVLQALQDAIANQTQEIPPPQTP